MNHSNILGAPLFPVGTREVALLIRNYCSYAWGFCGAKIKYLAGKFGRCERWLSDRLRALKEVGLLVVKHRGPHPAEYRIAPRFSELFAELFGPVSITERREQKLSTREVSTPLQASVGVEIGFDPAEPDSDHSIRTVWEDGRIVSEQEIRPDEDLRVKLVQSGYAGVAGSYGLRNSPSSGQPKMTSMASSGEHVKASTSDNPLRQKNLPAPEPPNSGRTSSPVERGKPGFILSPPPVQYPAPPPERNSAPVGFPEGVRQMIGICEASGKRLSRPDGQAAAATWMAKGCEPITGTVVAAYYSACRAASNPRYVPAPGPWLQMEGWTRGEVERILPKEGKVERAVKGALEILRLRRQA